MMETLSFSNLFFMGSLFPDVTTSDDTLPIVQAQSRQRQLENTASDTQNNEIDPLDQARQEQYARTAELAQIEAATKVGKLLRK